MKRELIIGVIVIVVLIIIIGVFLILVRLESQGSLYCTTAGKGYDSSQPISFFNPKNNCCDGLVEIDWAYQYEPNKEYADENGCVQLEGGQPTCSDCGNNNCERWENPCNCPEDCKS